jgi:hypothetical protein
MKRRIGLSMALVLASLLVAWPAWASQPSGPVRITTQISFTEFPFRGTFEVPEGGDLLGCSGGEFVDHPSGFQPPAKGDIAKIFTCTDGGAGTFTANFQPTRKPGPGDANGQWTITEATGAFAGLHGHGAFSVAYTGPESGVETLTGLVHFEP